MAGNDKVEIHCCACEALICVITEQAFRETLPPLLCDPCRQAPYTPLQESNLNYYPLNIMIFYYIEKSLTNNLTNRDFPLL